MRRRVRGLSNLHAGVVALAIVVLVMNIPAPASASSTDRTGTSTPSSSSLQALANGPWSSLPWNGAASTIPGALQVGSQPLDITTSAEITLNIQNSSALNQLDLNVSTPGSPSYAHFITEKQFIERFSPSMSVVNAIQSWLTSQGLSISYVAPDQRSITVDGTLAQFAQAFDVHFGTYSAPGLASFYAPTTSPSLPTPLAPYVLSVFGLDDARVPMVNDALRYTGQPAATTDAASQGQHTATLDPEFHQIYQLDQLYNSTGNKSSGVHPSFANGTTVAPDLWNETPNNDEETGPYTYTCMYNTTDVSEFFNSSNGYVSGFPKPVVRPYYNIPSYVGIPPSTTHFVKHANTCASANNGGGSGEVMMDFEAAGTTAVGANLSYVWVNGTTNWAAFIAMLNWIVSNDEAGLDLELNALTQSWGWFDADNCYEGPCLSTTYESDYSELSALGVSVFASSGDEDGNSGNTGTGDKCPTTAAKDPIASEIPADLPEATAVGGIAIDATIPATGGTTAGDDSGAQVWNWGCDGGEWVGSSGGVSNLYPAASWEYGKYVNSSMQWGMKENKANDGETFTNSTARPTPDWSGTADNINVYVNGAWSDGWGGTSDSSPGTAGLTAELTAFDGHGFGLITPLLYQLENQNLTGTEPGTPTLPNLRPTYEIANWSNEAYSLAGGTKISNFLGGPSYNLSAGWGIPLAMNIANLSGKPWIATNPEGHPNAGSNYYLNATVKDYRAVKYVNVTYLAPGASSWANATLSLDSGSNNKVNWGNWSGSIPGSALTEAGTLKYCISAVDSMEGNSWSPWNQSGWVINQHGSATPWTLFGCDHPFLTSVTASSLSVTGVTLNRTATGETSYSLCFNTTFSASVGGPFYLNWSWGDGTKTSTSVSASPAEACHVYSTAGTYPMYVFVNSSGNAHSAKSSTTSVVIYQHVLSVFTVSSTHPVAPANETFVNASSGGHGIFTLTWNFNDANASGASAPPYQIYYKPGTYTISLKVVDALGYSSTTSYTLTVYGASSEGIALYAGWNLIALPYIDNDYSLYELSVLVGAPLVFMERISGVSMANYSKTGVNAANGSDAFPAGEALWVDVSSATTLTVWGNSTATLNGVAFSPGWTGVGWSVSGSETASQVASLIAGAEAVSIWMASSQSWETYIVGFSDASYNFNVVAGDAVYVVTPDGGSFAE